MAHSMGFSYVGKFRQELVLYKNLSVIPDVAEAFL